MENSGSKYFSLRLLISLWCCSWLTVSAQEDATVVVVTNVKSIIRIDGIERGTTQPGSGFRLTVPAGEHYVEAQAASGNQETKGHIVTLEPGAQEIIKFEFGIVTSPSYDKVVTVAEINFDIPGSLEVAAWQTENPGKSYPYPTFYHAFEKGDRIVLDVTMTNAKGTNQITIATYPDGLIHYTNNSFFSLKGLTIDVPERSIYTFTLASNHILARNGTLKVARRPISEEMASFNSNVSYKPTYTPVQVLEPQNLFVNGGSNALFRGGKSRVSVPISLPQNTVEWFYRFAASRDAQDIEEVNSRFGLLGELSSLLLNLTGTGAVAANLVAETLQQPPGADYCDIILLNPEEVSAFESKSAYNYYREGTRENFKSGNVKITCCKTGIFYLGIRNPSPDYGVNVSIEAVAITATYDYVMEQID